VSQAAERLGVSVGTVRRWADEGHVQSFRTPGGQRRFDSDHIAGFLTSLERGPGARRRRRDDR
jgi:excisionase family DNA binding protein